ncbi:MAG: DUF5698 domain-containing protein [Anaerolineales bacterium]|nr:DUF5698 domain-containing protein [Anaerolineales bacterium]
MQTLLATLQSLISSDPTQIWSAVPAALVPVIIFLLRTTDQTLSTVRMLFISWGLRRAVWVIGLLQSLFFLSAVAGVFDQLTNPLNLIAFAAGYGAGSALGITIEGWLAPGHAILRVVSTGRSGSLVEGLRAAGRGVTEIPGQGLNGTVGVLLCSVPRRKIQDLRDQVLEIDPNAFVTSEKIRILGGGWIH